MKLRVKSYDIILNLTTLSNLAFPRFFFPYDFSVSSNGSCVRNSAGTRIILRSSTIGKTRSLDASIEKKKEKERKRKKKEKGKKKKNNNEQFRDERNCCFFFGLPADRRV